MESDINEKLCMVQDSVLLRELQDILYGSRKGSYRQSAYVLQLLVCIEGIECYGLLSGAHCAYSSMYSVYQSVTIYMVRFIISPTRGEVK